MPKKRVSKAKHGGEGDADAGVVAKGDANVENVVKMINIITDKVKVLQIVSDEGDDALLQKLSEVIKADIDNLTGELKKINQDGEEVLVVVKPFQEKDFDGVDSDLMGKVQHLVSTTTIGGRRWKKTRGGQAAVTPQTASTTYGAFNPTALNENVKLINSVGSLDAPNPASNALSGTQVMLGSPDSFSSGSFANVSTIPVDVAKVFTPSLGQSGGRKKKK